MATLRPILFIVLAFFAHACSNNAGTNPFLTGDGGMTTGADGGTQTGCQGCTEGAECFNGDESEHCGSGGNECVVCASTEVCTEDGSCIDSPMCGPNECPGCCDGTGGCQAGDDEVWCGSGGLQCATCDPGYTCEQGVCRPPCGPDTCAGCCDPTGACIAGDTTTSCGTAGAVCADCGADGCSMGQCVSTACADSCAGCCDGDVCIEPTTDSQCGASGDACVSCAAGTTCGAGGCAVDPTSMWTLFLVSGEVGATTADGSSWDGFNGLPDPFVTATIPNQADVSSATIDDTLTPQWNTALTTAAAADLLAGFQLGLFDSDVAFSDEICTIDVTLAANEFAGGLVESPCPDAALGSLTWRLEPAP